jgi:uncharacterized protein
VRVNIDEIKEAGLERAWDMTREQVDEMVRDDRAGYRAGGPAHVTARLDRLGRLVRLRARAGAELTCPCGRCLAPVSVKLPVAFDLTLVPAGKAEAVEHAERGDREDRGEGHSGGSFAPKDLEEETYEGKVIDLDPIVREQVLLALPGYPVCQEGCKGLCSVCGANLNERDCGCDRRVPDPRWASLEKLKIR